MTGGQINNDVWHKTITYFNYCVINNKKLTWSAKSTNLFNIKKQFVKKVIMQKRTLLLNAVNLYVGWNLRAIKGVREWLQG